MSSQKFLIADVVFGIASDALAQQDSITVPHFDLKGTLQYSANSVPGSSVYRGETRGYTWALQPGFGVFVAGLLQVDTEIRFQRTTTEVDYPGNQWEARRTTRATSDEISLAVGPCYNLPMSSRAWAFVSVKIGLLWRGTLQETSYSWGTPHDEGTNWAPRDIVFPLLQAGIKLYVAPQSFLMLDIQYDRLSELERRTTTIGIGLGVVL